ncbi:hypothetical protein BT63DRAFT_160732 [Microthyrium microscopicum]|uniref:Uncharacterized protein n=1 Tax=Microthyrium microscopicum TaxID=703497 RepID=A0A6A6UMU1_9PEZI|nr:hypothetical protein BT63DRAFT_160732 [Microthyrium microscopicum]
MPEEHAGWNKQFDFSSDIDDKSQSSEDSGKPQKRIRPALHREHSDDQHSLRATLEAFGNRVSEHLSSHSSAESNPAQLKHHHGPDMRMFKLAARLKKLKKIEAERQLRDGEKWKGRAGPVDPSDAGSDHVLTPLSEERPAAESLESRRLRSPLKELTDSFLGAFGRKKLESISSSPSRSAPDGSELRQSSVPSSVRRTSKLSSLRLSREDRLVSLAPTKAEVMTGSERKASAPPQDPESAVDVRPCCTVSSFRRDDNDGESENDGLRASSNSNRSDFKLGFFRSNPIRVSPDADSKSTLSAKTTKSKSRPSFLKLGHSSSDQQVSWFAKLRHDPAEKSAQSPSSTSSPNFDGVSYFSKRRESHSHANSPYAESKSHPVSPAPPSACTFNQRIATPGPNQMLPFLSDVHLPALPPLQLKNKGKRRGHLPQSAASRAREEVTLSEEEADVAPRDWYQVRLDNILDDSYDNYTAGAASLRDIPDHLPNSPMCPRHPKHPTGGTGICPVHGKMSTQVRSSPQLPL